MTVYNQMRQLAEMGFLSVDSEDPEQFGLTEEQGALLIPLLARPEAWAESPKLSACQDALQVLKQSYDLMKEQSDA